MNSKYLNRFVKVALLLTLLSASGCRFFSSPTKRIDRGSSLAASYLDFDKDQKKLLTTITEELKKDIQEDSKWKLSLKEEMQKMVNDPELNKARVKEILIERQSRIQARYDKYLDLYAPLHKSLTEEQRKDINKILNDYAESLSE